MNIFEMFSGFSLTSSSFKLTDDKIEVMDSIRKCIISLGDTKPLVKKGDEVSVGQVIGEKLNDEDVSVISTVDGVVSEISERINKNGEKVKSVVISDIKIGKKQNNEININDLSKEAVLCKIEELSILNEGDKSLASVIRKNNGTKIQIRMFEDEPNFKYKEVSRILSKEFEKGKSVLEKATSAEIVLVDKNSDLLNDELVIDMYTVISLGESFLTGIPCIYEYVTIFGGAVKANKVYKVIKGTTLEELFEKLDGNEAQLSKVVVGGALKGNSLFTTDVAISNNSKSILFLNKSEGEKGAAQNCIRCSKCLRVCPKGLNPIKLVELWNRKEKDEFIKFGGYHCIECGKCSYVCPSKIEIANSISTAKDYLK